MDSSSESDVAVNSAGSENSPPAKNPYRRVKVYMLNNERAWDDKGTGHVACGYVERLQGAALIVRSEEDERTVILESKICPNTAYQKQQDTLICWSENEQELALSFQLIDSCSEIWEKICDVQGRDPGDNPAEDSLQDSREDEHLEDSYATSLLIELPTPDLAHLAEIQTLFTEQTMHGGGVQWRIEKLSTSIETENYIPKLLDLFTMCDDLENTEALHQLFTILKTIFMLNKSQLFEVMFSSENLMRVVGVMEYDPCKKERVQHRDFLEKQAKYHHVLPIKNETLLDKIHQTYRVQYIQDVILPTPSVFDDNILSALNSFIFFNKCEIVKMIQEDETLMRSLFQQLTDDETDDAARRNLIKFLKEFCMFSSSLQPSEREHFFQTLSDMRVLEAIETLWNLEDADILSTANDVFAFIADTNPTLVREFCLSEAKLGHDDLLMTKAIEQMQNDSDPEMGGAVLLSVTIRLLIDPENMLTTTSTAGTPTVRTEKTEFLNYFYTHCMQTLLNPLTKLTRDSPCPEDYKTSQLLNLTVELLAFCAEHHSYNFRIHMIKHDVLRKVLFLLKSKHAFLALCVVRLVRKIVSLKDEAYNRHIVACDHLKPICEAFLDNGEKYNLFNSAVIELFEFIRGEGIRSLADYFVESHYHRGFAAVTYVKTFTQLRDQFGVRSSPADGASEGGAMGTSGTACGKTGMPSQRFRRDNNTLEEDEEMWFNGDEDIEETPGNVTPPLQEDIDGELYKTAFPKSLREKAKEDDDSDLTFNNGGAKYQRAISFNLKSIMNAAATVSPPDSPPGGDNSSTNTAAADVSTTTSTVNKPTATVTSATAAALHVSPPSAAPATTTPVGKMTSLVDYPDEDSDEDTESDSTSSPTSCDQPAPSKRIKLDLPSS